MEYEVVRIEELVEAGIRPELELVGMLNGRTVRVRLGDLATLEERLNLAMNRRVQAEAEARQEAIKDASLKLLEHINGVEKTFAGHCTRLDSAIVEKTNSERGQREQEDKQIMRELVKAFEQSAQLIHDEEIAREKEDGKLSADLYAELLKLRTARKRTRENVDAIRQGITLENQSDSEGVMGKNWFSPSDQSRDYSKATASVAYVWCVAKWVLEQIEVALTEEKA